MSQIKAIVGIDVCSCALVLKSSPICLGRDFSLKYRMQLVKTFPDETDGVQVGLDIAGLVPGFREIADGINALIYTGRGDYVNAGLSAAAMVLFAGWAATGEKLGNKALSYSKLADKAHGTASTFNKTTPINSKIMFNDITQGSSKASHSNTQRANCKSRYWQWSSYTNERIR